MKLILAVQSSKSELWAEITQYFVMLNNPVLLTNNVPHMWK